jgi:hypothetical protein
MARTNIEIMSKNMDKKKDNDESAKQSARKKSNSKEAVSNS